MRTARLLALLLLAVLAASCGVSDEVYNRDVASLRDQINELRLEGEKLQTEKQRCLESYASLSKEKGNLSEGLTEAQRKIQELEAVAAERKAALDKLAASLSEMVAAGKISVEMRQGRLVVQISENILFDVGRSKLKPEGNAALAELAPLLAAANRDFQVTGHTDNTGAPETNWRLSLDRALSVLLRMIEAGYPPQKLSAAGYALYQPVANNSTKEGRQLNRRVEIQLIPNLSELELPGFSDACRDYYVKLAD